jgi:hypothetical protein
MAKHGDIVRMVVNIGSVLAEEGSIIAQHAI